MSEKKKKKSQICTDRQGEKFLYIIINIDRAAKDTIVQQTLKYLNTLIPIQYWKVNLK